MTQVLFLMETAVLNRFLNLSSQKVAMKRGTVMYQSCAGPVGLR